MDNMNWDYIAGYFDGEGCLLMGVFQDSRRSWKSEIDYYNFIPSASISSYDYEVLERMKIFLEHEGLITSHYYLKPVRGNQTKKAARLSINGHKNLKKFIDLIVDKSICKKPQMLIYYEINKIIIGRQKRIDSIGRKQVRWEKTDWLKTMKLVDKLNSLKSKTRGRKWYDFFSRKWRMKI